MTDTIETTQANAEVLEVLEGRVKQYSFLARLFREEVDMEEIRQLQGMRFPLSTGNSNVDAGYRDLYDYLKGAWQDSARELAIDYVHTFIGHGVNGYSAAYPFESVYTSERRLLMQEARAEVLATLRENGLKRGMWNEGEDHIALELEFMQIMGQRAIDSLKNGNEEEAVECLEKSQSFLQNHLLNWVPMLAADMEKFAHTSFYRGLGKLCLGFVEVDKDTLEELLSEED